MIPYLLYKQRSACNLVPGALALPAVLAAYPLVRFSLILVTCRILVALSYSLWLRCAIPTQILFHAPLLRDFFLGQGHTPHTCTRSALDTDRRCLCCEMVRQQKFQAYVHLLIV